MSLGAATASNVGDVRKLAKKLYHQKQLGQDPAAEKHETRVQSLHNFKSIVEEFLVDQKPKWRSSSYPEFARYLLTHAKPLHQLPIQNISRADIAAIHAAVTKNRGAYGKGFRPASPD
jgi:hypothetical protein